MAKDGRMERGMRVEMRRKSGKNKQVKEKEREREREEKQKTSEMTNNMFRKNRNTKPKFKTRHLFYKSSFVQNLNEAHFFFLFLLCCIRSVVAFFFTSLVDHCPFSFLHSWR